MALGLVSYDTIVYNVNSWRAGVTTPIHPNFGSWTEQKDTDVSCCTFTLTFDPELFC